METTQTETAALLLSDFNFTKGIQAYSNILYSNLMLLVCNIEGENAWHQYVISWLTNLQGYKRQFAG